MIQTLLLSALLLTAARDTQQETTRAAEDTYIHVEVSTVYLAGDFHKLIERDHRDVPDSEVFRKLRIARDAKSFDAEFDIPVGMTLKDMRAFLEVIQGTSRASALNLPIRRLRSGETEGFDWRTEKTYTTGVNIRWRNNERTIVPVKETFKFGTTASVSAIASEHRDSIELFVKYNETQLHHCIGTYPVKAFIKQAGKGYVEVAEEMKEPWITKFEARERITVFPGAEAALVYVGTIPTDRLDSPKESGLADIPLLGAFLKRGPVESLDRHLLLLVRARIAGK